MLISQEIWPSQSQWSSLRIIFNVDVYTKELCYNTINPRRSELRDIILGLVEEGYSNKEVSEYLNERQIKTPRHRSYTPKLIWVTLKKWREREERLNIRRTDIGDITIKFYL
jgi:hypothetical protein